MYLKVKLSGEFGAIKVHDDIAVHGPDDRELVARAASIFVKRALSAVPLRRNPSAFRVTVHAVWVEGSQVLTPQQTVTIKPPRARKKAKR